MFASVLTWMLSHDHSRSFGVSIILEERSTGGDPWYVQEPMRGSFMLTLHTGGIPAQKDLGMETPSQFSKAAEMFSLKEILSGLDM
jgi:hypothetical protein